MAFILKWPSLRQTAVHLSILVSLVWDVCACTRRIFFFLLLLFSIRDGRDGESPIACGDSGLCHRHHIYRLSVIFFSLLWSPVLVTECCCCCFRAASGKWGCWVVVAWRKERRTRSEGRGDGHHHHHHHHYLVCGHKASVHCALSPSLFQRGQPEQSKALFSSRRFRCRWL